MKKITAFLVKVKNLFLNKKFMLFCLFGIINTVNTALFAFLAGLVIQENISAILGYVLSLQGAFLLTCKFIFRSSPTWVKYKRFLLSYIPSFILYILIHAGALSALKLPQFWASFIAVTFSGPLTYFIVKIYAFGKLGANIDKKRSQNEENNA